MVGPLIFKLTSPQFVPQTWAYTIIDPVLQIFRSMLHRALRSEPFFSNLLPMERPGLCVFN